VESKLNKLLMQNPLHTDYQEHYEQLVRDAVKQQIFDFLYDEKTGLPVDDYNDEDMALTENVYWHVYRVYLTVPSPVYV